MYDELLQLCDQLLTDIEDEEKTVYNLKLYIPTLRKIAELFYPDLNKDTKTYPHSHDFYTALNLLRETAMCHTLIISFYEPMMRIINAYALDHGKNPPQYILEYNMRKRQVLHSPFINIIQDIELKEYVALYNTRILYLNNSRHEESISENISHMYYDQYGVLNIQPIR